LGDFEKKYPASRQAHVRKKKNPAQDHRPPKKFTHVQWAGKKFWQDISWVDTLNF